MREMPDGRLLRAWESLLPFKTPNEASEHWVKEMQEFDPRLNLGFNDFFVARMHKFWTQYHPTMLYRLTHYYADWASKEKFGNTFSKDFPSASDWCNNLPQMAADLIRDGQEHHPEPYLVLGIPYPRGPWRDRAFGLHSRLDGTPTSQEIEAYGFQFMKRLYWEPVVSGEDVSWAKPPSVQPSRSDSLPKETSEEKELVPEEGAIEEP